MENGVAGTAVAIGAPKKVPYSPGMKAQTVFGRTHEFSPLSGCCFGSKMLSMTACGLFLLF